MANKLQYTYRSAANLSDDTLEFIRSGVEEAGSFPRFVDRLVASQMAGEGAEVDPALLVSNSSGGGSMRCSFSDTGIREQMALDKDAILEAIENLADIIGESDGAFFSDETSSRLGQEDQLDIDELREGIVSDMKRVLDVTADRRLLTADDATSSSTDVDFLAMKTDIMAAINEALSSRQDCSADDYCSSVRAESDVRELIAVKKEEIERLEDVLSGIGDIKKGLTELLSRNEGATIDEIAAVLEPRAIAASRAEEIAEQKRDAWSEQMAMTIEESVADSFLEGPAGKNVDENTLDEEAGYGDDMGVDAAVENSGVSEFPMEDEEFAAGLADLLFDDDEAAKQQVIEQELRNAWNDSLKEREVSLPSAFEATPKEPTISTKLDDDMMVGAAMLLLDE